MADRSAIEWTDATWNPIRARNKKTGKVGWHCEHATPGCEFCYAEGFNKRLGTGLSFKPGHRNDIEIFLDEEMLTLPLRWKKPRMIFVCSMTDLFADFVPAGWIDKIFAVMALSPQHTFQVLTKRAARMRDYFAGEASLRSSIMAADMIQSDPHWPWPLPNAWLGVSTERQQEADERIPLLLQTPAAVRFISAEPLLGPIDLSSLSVGDDLKWNSLGGRGRQGGLDWVIAGGESGPGARPMHPDWARGLRDQCGVAGVPFFFKQWGAWGPIGNSDGADDAGWRGRGDWMILAKDGDLDIPDHRWPDEEAGECAVVKVGKAKAGRSLDGIEHNEMPGRG